LTIYFNSLPKIIERSDEAVIDQLKAEITNINSSPSFADLKQELENKQKELEMHEILSKDLEKYLTRISKEEKDIINVILNLIVDYLIQSNLFRNIDIEYLEES
ncbi:hypothetical protein V6O07_18045, partial [Arthrospira platensis SPKY2]